MRDKARIRHLPRYSKDPDLEAGMVLEESVRLELKDYRRLG